MAGTSVIKAVPQQDSLSELRIFVAGATRTVKTNPLELARTALSLLKTLPSTIDAVLEYFCALFDVAVAKYVSQIESDMCSGASSAPVSTHEEATIAEIHSVLCSCVTSSPEAWVPIISKWSLELLGELSSKYAGRAHVPITAGLNETLQLWMSCRATRTLIDITTQCLSCRMLSDTETCINSLLDTSVVHSPHFDWVVAHVGSCFPHTVITRVLSCGLKDFCHHASSSFTSSGIGVGKDAASEGGPSGTAGVVAAPKVNSVVGILGHLAGSHFKDIRTALLDLFKWSLEEEDDEMFALGTNLEAEEGVAHRIATVPFLLHLASLSPMLLRALTTDVLQTLTPSMLPRLARLSPAWCRFFGGRQALQDLVVHLALGCERGGTQILRLLIDAATSQPTNDTNISLSLSSQVRENCAEILELLLQEIDVLVRSGASAAPCPSPSPAGGGHSGGMISLGSGNERWVPILSSVCHEASAIRPLLLAGDEGDETASCELVSRTGVRLVSLLASAHLGPSLAAEAAAFLLRRASNNFQLATFLQLLRHTQASLPTLATDTLRRVLDCLPGDGIDDDGYTGKDEPPLRFWLNLYLLLKHEALDAHRRTCHSGQVTAKHRQRSHPYSGDHLPHRPMLDAVRAVLSDITSSLCTSRSITMRHAAALVLERALPQTKEVSAVSIFSSPELSLKLARAAVVHFFLSAAEQELEVEPKDLQEAASAGITVSGTSGCRVACRILSRLVPISSAARALALRDLLEGALVHQETASLFGAKLSTDNFSSLNQLATKGKSPLSRAVLLWENGRPRTALPRRHSSVFGVGDGDLFKCGKIAPKPPCEEVVALNIQMLVEAVKCCCTVTKQSVLKELETDTSANGQATYGTTSNSTTGSVSLDAISMVSLLLVEIVSPDVMYNGLPWPEEEFCKVTIERDLQIRRTFERLPVLWALLTLAATHRPALCYCSVLLRAIMATLLAQWNSHTTATNTATSNSFNKLPPPPSLLVNTQRLIDLMALGQLLPSPLSAIRDVIPKIGPHEVVVLLRDIWNYTHENVPSPALFSQDAGSGLVWRQGMGPGAEEVEGGEISSARPIPRHTDALRHTLQLHIESLGTLYPRLFSLNPKTVPSSPASPNPEDCGKVE